MYVYVCGVFVSVYLYVFVYIRVYFIVIVNGPNVSAASYGSLTLLIKHSYNSPIQFLEKQLGVRITTTEKHLSIKGYFTMCPC